MVTELLNKAEVSRLQEITQLHNEIGGYLKMSLEKAIRIGELLVEQKNSLKHGGFISWVKDNLPFTDRTARNYMGLYRERDRLKTETVSDLGVTGGYRMLTAPLADLKISQRERRLEAERKGIEYAKAHPEEVPYTTVIEAEYRVSEAPQGGEKIGEAEAEKPAERVGAAAPTLQPKPRAQAKKAESVPTKTKSPDEVIEGETFSIDLTWLKESQKTLKWTDDTMLTFIISQYKVSGTSVTGALNKLTREQAEDFTKQINSRLENQPGLFD